MGVKRMETGYKKLTIYKKAHELGLAIHKFTLTLPQFELYEEGSQIRRSSESVSSNIVEGYSLRYYKNAYIRYLYLAYASAQETIEHLDYLFETGSLKDNTVYKDLRERYFGLCGMIFNFIQSVQKQHKSDR
jgi:four helix bundle protein